MRFDLIYGGFGQDGRITSRLLSAREHAHVLVGRDSHQCRMPEPVGSPCIFGGDCDGQSVSVVDFQTFFNKGLVRDVYFFAAHHASSEARQVDALDAIRAFETNYHLFNQLLTVIGGGSQTRAVFYAGSMKVFEGTTQPVVTEDTPSMPRSAYGYSKAMTREMISLKKEHVDYRIYNGIFFNHESVFRGEDFFTSKVISQAIDVKLGLRDKIEVNNLSGSVDIGLAADYCEAAMKLQDANALSGDYIFSSGELTSLRFFVETVLSILDIPNFPVTQKDLEGGHREPRAGIRGDSGKLQSTLGFKPRQPEEWIRLLIEDYWEVKSRDS